MNERDSSRPLLDRPTWTLLIAIAITGVYCVVMAIAYKFDLFSSIQQLRHIVLGRVIGRSDSWMPMMTALDYFQQHGSGMYEAVFFGERIKFQYPPSSLLPLMALQQVTPLTYELLNSINYVLFPATCALIGVFTHQVIGVVDRERAISGPVRLLTVLYVTGATLIYYPIFYAAYLGQVQVWMGFLFFLACIAYLGDRRLVAGLLIGLIVVLKPQFALFGLWALVRRDFRFFIGIALTAGVINLISLFIFGLADHLDYLRTLSYISARGESYWGNQSVNGILHRFLGGNPVWLDHEFAPYIPFVHISTLLTSALLAISALIFPRSDRPIYGVLALLTASLAFSMASPITWEHHYGVLPPMLAILLIHAMTGRMSLLQKVFLALGYVFTSTFIWSLAVPATSRLMEFAQNHIFYGALILMVLSWSVALRQTASGPWLFGFGNGRLRTA